MAYNFKFERLVKILRLPQVRLRACRSIIALVRQRRVPIA